ncbi:MAG: ferritin-like domain-containing protein, partial [Parvularculaceae bacterium]
PDDHPLPPDQPSRPIRPELVPPGKLARRGIGSPEGRKALLHSLAHIEFNAIDLAFDMALRFAPQIREVGLSFETFVRDWFSVGADEARHFRMLVGRLSDLGAEYGDLPAHDGLWQSAESTKDNVLARLAIVPLVLEARGLDLTPGLADRFRRVGDGHTASVLDIIWRDELAHVAAGARWFNEICRVKALEPASEFKRLVRKHFHGDLKPPFDVQARDAAGVPRTFYDDWNGNCRPTAGPRV